MVLDKEFMQERYGIDLMKRQRLQCMFFAVTLMLCCSASLSFASALPDTGQTQCYDPSGLSGNVIACAGSGQDGAYILNPMSFTDNGNSTGSDNVTGLMWQKQDDGTTRTWANAGTYCSSLSIGGYSDWRLPTVTE